ncbi:hypothetical protein AMTR_s00030p00089450 [Amborella trichopoda]|uniref:Uncharacterized protein n=1 Tax=Amborella trichopoda TaxID=13333 RepID=U5D3Q5_AMBTC|nr:hypothetical protein AMTR_s00030p00089450 [Amborella trichopoda]
MVKIDGDEVCNLWDKFPSYQGKKPELNWLVIDDLQRYILTSIPTKKDWHKLVLADILHSRLPPERKEKLALRKTCYKVH